MKISPLLVILQGEDRVAVTKYVQYLLQYLSQYLSQYLYDHREVMNDRELYNNVLPALWDVSSLGWTVTI